MTADLRQRRPTNPENDRPSSIETNENIPPPPSFTETPIPFSQRQSLDELKNINNERSRAEVQKSESSKRKILRRVLYGFGMFSVFCGSVSLSVSSFRKRAIPSSYRMCCVLQYNKAYIFLQSKLPYSTPHCTKLTLTRCYVLSFALSFFLYRYTWGTFTSVL